MPLGGGARVVLAVGALAATVALAAPVVPERSAPEWLGKEFGFVADNESLRSLLYDFGTSLDVPVSVSGRITAIADGEVAVAPAERFLAELHRRFGVIWVYDGAMLYLYDTTETATRTVDYPYPRRAAFGDTVDAAGIRGAPLNWTFIAADNTVQIAGPPRFVEWASEMAEAAAAADAGSASDAGALTIRIFAIEHGQVGRVAGDGDGQGAAPSLAEMVAKLMNVAHVSGVGVPDASAARTGPPLLRGSGVIGADTAPPAAAGGTAGVVGRRAAADEAFVVGDPRLNAIIVRDYEERMPAYERLITALDAPVDQVEITVSVLDIDASAAEELRLSLGSDSAQLDAGAATGSTFEFGEQLFDVDGIALRVRAQNNTGKSRILTQPSVTTLDNHEASFRNNRTFYVRLGGTDAEAVDLAPVSYGWVVRIRPHIVRDGDEARVRLGIHIEDGTRGGAELAVTGVPEVSQNVIRTQAVVGEGRSLLIGGYTVREEIRFRQRLPLVGRVPLVGRLLSARLDRDQQVSRYFLITPRILPVEIAYEIKTGFETDPLDEAPVVPVAVGSSPAATSSEAPTHAPIQTRTLP